MVPTDLLHPGNRILFRNAVKFSSVKTAKLNSFLKYTVSGVK
jgi:hypothetical protein